jgi:hypothetical protein
VHIAAIDALPIRRKLKTTIDAQAKIHSVTADRTGAPMSKPISTDTEKRRLQAINTLKGGKALPEELTMPSIRGEIPLSMVASKPRPAGSRQLGSQGAGSPVRAPDSRELREMNAMFNEIMVEMQQEEALLRRAQLDAESRDERVAEQGASVVQVAMGRIRDKVADMQKLDRLIRTEKGRLRALNTGLGAY